MKSVQRWVLSSALWMYHGVLWITLLPEVFKSTRKVQNVRQGGNWEVAIRNKKCSKLRDVQQVVASCSIGKCSKAGAFPALWWLSGTVYSGECLKVPEKCSV